MRLAVGTQVEICPARAGGKIQRDYAVMDGCQGEVVHISDNGTKAQVKVVSSNKSLAGGIAVPIKALKELESE